LRSFNLRHFCFTAAWRDGIGDGFLDTAVDMTLRLDNACALPTSDDNL
jgi:hypothetical protein